jgi:hypothetical protein
VVCSNSCQEADFPTRVVNNSFSMIDNIFIDKRRNYTIKLCINGLPDHDAQLKTLNKFSLPINNIEYIMQEVLIIIP